MLNPFPDLLVLGFFAPTLLRAVAGILFLFLANTHLKASRPALTAGLSLHFGDWAARLITLVGVLEILIGGFLFTGFYTQIAALAGLLLMILFLFLRRAYGPTIPSFSFPFYLLLATVCASLLLSGAGAIAFDLPL